MSEDREALFNGNGLFVPANLGDDDEIMCEECGMIFTIIWRRDAVYTCPEYCPFCGANDD